MKQLKFMSPEWVDDFNRKPYAVRLGLFKGFTTWQRMWYLTTAIDTTDGDQVEFRKACRELLPKPDVNAAITPIDYSLIRKDVWNEPEL